MHNKGFVKHFYETVISDNLLKQLPNYIESTCVVRIGEQVFPLGLEGMKQHIIDTKKTYPDYRMTILRQFCDGEYVISEFLMEGTHEGEWLGIQPTHKRLSFTGVDIDKVVNGKIVEHGGACNTFETLYEHQLITTG